MRSGLCVLAIFVALLGDCGAQSAETQSRLLSAYERVRNACPLVVADGGPGAAGSFSAVIVSRSGLVLTAGHCLMGDPKYQVVLPDGRSLRAEALGRDTRVDCGMMRITNPPEDLPFVDLGHPTLLKANDPLFGIGYPGEPTAGRGPVLRFGRLVTEVNNGTKIQSSVLMEPGDSGGPLFDLEGRLVGIHSHIGSAFDENFDVSIDVSRVCWSELLTKGAFSAWKVASDELCFSVTESDDGLRVKSLSQAASTQARGLLLGDQITRVNAKAVASLRDFERLIQKGWKSQLLEPLTLDVLRGGDEVEVSLRSRFCATPVMASQTTDDAVVVIESERGDEALVIRGVVVDGDGTVVSKSSEVGDHPRISQDDGEVVALAVVLRDPAHDLVLLKAPGTLDSAVIDFGRSGIPDVGTFVSTLRRAEGEGELGVVSTRLFRPTRRLEIGVSLSESDEGLVVSRVFPRSPAKKCGLKKGDRILVVDRQRVSSVRAFSDYVHSERSVEAIVIRFQREGALLGVRVQPRVARDGAMGPHVAHQSAGAFSRRRRGFPLAFGHDIPLLAQECGSPLFDLKGRCVGLNVARASRTQSLALPAFVVRRFLAPAEPERPMAPPRAEAREVERPPMKR